jgi:hypothetical protein
MTAQGWPAIAGENKKKVFLKNDCHNESDFRSVTKMLTDHTIPQSR